VVKQSVAVDEDAWASAFSTGGGWGDVNLSALVVTKEEVVVQKEVPLEEKPE
jgi:hypothetical protein